MDKIDFLLIVMMASSFISGWMLQLFAYNYSRTNKVKLIILGVGISLFFFSIWAGFQL